jgi:hypothetical protein
MREPTLAEMIASNLDGVPLSSIIRKNDANKKDQRKKETTEDGLLPPNKVKPRVGIRGRDIYPSILAKDHECCVFRGPKNNIQCQDEEGILATTLPHRK